MRYLSKSRRKVLPGQRSSTINSRVTEGPPFQYTGVDYAGPMWVKDEKKVYVSLFTCAVTRAIHLEIAEDLSVVAFLRAFRRFISRRGIPELMISDNAKNFQGAAEELTAHSTQIMVTATDQNFIFNKGIKWQFIVARAAWCGGFYERLIGMVKRSLKKSIGRCLLDIEELTTVITEVEAVINSRPVTYVYNELEEGSPLTPAHLLCGKRLISIPDVPKRNEVDDPDFVPNATKKELSRRLKIRNRNMKTFWSCWRKEYLVNLREHDQVVLKRSKDAIVPHVGDIVLLGDQTPRSR